MLRLRTGESCRQGSRERVDVHRGPPDPAGAEGNGFARGLP